MNMSISSINSSVDFNPLLELSGKQRIAAEQFAASLPGNSAQTDKPHQNIRHATSDIARVSEAFNKRLQFVVDHQSNEVIVKVIDKNTDKVIKVLPPEELQRLHRKLKETIGFLFDEQV